MGIQFNGNNNPFWFINGKRDMKPNQPDKVIENKVQEGNMQPANTLQEETSDAPMLSFFDLDFQSMYESNNVTVNVTPNQAPKKTYTPKIIQPAGYENDFKFETKEEAVSKMKLRQTSCSGVYCELHNPNMPAGNYTKQRHYVWNEASKQMIELKDVYHLDASGSQAKGLDGYEEVQAYINGYNFTDEVGVYEKDGQKFNFNAEKSEFSKSADISNYSNNDVESMKNEIEEFLLEVDGIDVSGDNYARHLNKEQYNKFSSFAALLSDKNRFPGLTLEFEYKEDGLCDVYLRLNNESVYSVDDLDASQVKQLLAEAKEKSENMEPSLDVNNLSAESVKNYLMKEFSALFKEGYLNDDFCKMIADTTSKFIEFNEGVGGLDNETIIKTCIETQAELAYEAQVLGFDVEWFINETLAEELNLLFDLEGIEETEKTEEAPQTNRAPALAPAFDGLDESSGNNIPKELENLLKKQFGNYSIVEDKERIRSYFIQDAFGNNVGSINFSGQSKCNARLNFSFGYTTYNYENDNLKKQFSKFDYDEFLKAFQDNTQHDIYFKNGLNDIKNYINMMSLSDAMGMIAILTKPDCDGGSKFLSNLSKEYYDKYGNELNSIYQYLDKFEEEPYELLKDCMEQLVKKAGYNDLARLVHNSDYSSSINDELFDILGTRIYTNYSEKTKFQWNTEYKISNTIKQGNTADCGMLSAIISSTNNSELNAYLDSIITKDNDKKTITVKLNGKEYKYKFSEIAKATELSTDNYMARAFEMAMRESLAENGNQLKFGKLPEFLKALTGRYNKNIISQYSPNDKSHIGINFDDLLKQIKSNEYMGITNLAGNYNITLEDAESGEKIKMDTHHAYAIVGYDKKTNSILLKNPYNSSQLLRMSVKDFEKYCESQMIKANDLIKALSQQSDKSEKDDDKIEDNSQKVGNGQINNDNNRSDKPNKPNLDEPEVLNTPNQPSLPETSDTPDLPNHDIPDTPDIPDIPNEPNMPDIPDTPDVPGVNNNHNTDNEDNSDYDDNDNGNNNVDKDNNNVDNTGNEDGNGGVNNNNDIDNNDGLDDLDFSGLDSGNNDGNNNTTILESGTDDLSSLFKTTTTTHSGGETTGSITSTVTDDERNTIIQNAIADKYQELVQKYGKDANIHVTVDSNGQMSWDVYQGSGYDYASQIINNIKNGLLNNPNYLFASTDGTASGDGGLGALLDIEAKLQNGEYNTESGEIDYGKLYTDLAMNGLGGISGINTQTSPDSNETRVIITKANGEVEIYATPSTPESPDTPNQNETSALTTNTTETTETDDYGMVWNVETETTTDVNGTVVNETVTKTSENGTKETVTTTRNNDGSYTKHTEITSGGKVVRSYDEDYTVIDGRVTASTTTYYDIDENGNKVYSGKEITTRNYNDDGSYVNDTIEYDKDNNITHESSVLYANDEEYTQWEKEYNDDGTITTTSYVYQKDEDGDLYENATMTSITDNDGNVTTTTIEGNTHIISVVDKNGNLISEVVQTYNDDGELVDEEKTFGTNDINTPGTYVDNEAGKGYEISADAQSELMEAILRFNAFPDDQLKALADAIKNGFVPDDLLYLLDEDLKDIFTSLTNGEVPLSSADPDKNFNGFVLPNGGGNMLESYAEKLVSMGMYSDIKAARDGICGYLGLDSGMAVFTEIADELANIIDKMLKDDSLGMGLLKEQLESAYSVAMYAKEVGDNDRYNMYIAEAANYVQKIERHNLVQEISEQLYGSIAKAITIDDGSGTLGVMVDYNSIYNYVYDMIDRDYAAGYNSYQIHLRAADRFANIDELKSMLDEGADSDDVLRMLGYIENDDIKSYSWLNDQDLFAGVNTSYQSHTPQHQRYKQYQKVSYIESLQWKIKCMREDMGNDSARNTPSFVNDWLFGECNSHFYDAEIEALERELEKIQHTINNYRDNYYNAIIKFGINSDQAQNALDAYQNVLEEYNSPDSYRAELTLTFYYA